VRRLVLVLLSVACASSPGLRKFPDRPVAWQEHDDAPVKGTPAKTRWEKIRSSHGLIEALARRGDRALAMKLPGPADDVNAVDEVPCSTWFCPRNHRRPMTPEEVAAGPGRVPPPVPPFLIEKSKGAGAALGLIVEDSNGAKWIVKFDPARSYGLQTGAEALGTRLFHAAGYYVPDSYILDIDPHDLRLSSKATYFFEKYAERPLTPKWLRDRLDDMARGPDGKLRAVAIAFLPGKLLGGFDHQGRRDGDPNDRIPHERRRSVRATRVLSAWLNRFDAGPSNTLDALVEERGRRFVRHYIIDFGSSLGAATVGLQAPNDGAESYYAPQRMLRAFLGVGAWQRPWQRVRGEWEESVRRHPSFGFFPEKNWDPEGYRSNYPYAAFDLREPADDYFGAKLVAAFTDAQLRAAVEAAGYPARDAPALVRALAARRDIVARRYLGPMTAVEDPSVNDAGTMLCFRDVALERGVHAPGRLSYRVRVVDDEGRRLLAERAHPRAARGCLPIGASNGRPYRVVTLIAETPEGSAIATHVHVALRPAEGRWVVVGMERDD
jgi:hypothetical protein